MTKVSSNSIDVAAPKVLETTPESNLLGLGLLDEVSALLAILPVWKTVGEGESVTLSIGVDVIGLVSLQWYFNGQPIVGADKGTLVIPSVRSSEVGRYQLRATLLGITLVSIPTDIQINATDDTIDRSVAAFDTLRDAISVLAQTKSAMRAKSGTVSHGYSGTQIFNTLGSTKDAGEPDHCGIPGGASEWYAWQSPTNGMAVINTDGSNFDTVLAVYVGPGDSYTTLTNVACDNDSGANGKTSRVSFSAKAGTIYYIAVDGVNGASGTVKLNFAVGTPAAITAQPLSRTAALGASAALMVGAGGFPSPRYQWMFNGVNIPNATNASLILNGITAENFGSYNVRVTNTFNALLSGSANLVRETPLRFSSQHMTTNGFQLSIIGPAGTDYVIDCSTNMAAWTPLTTNHTQTGLVDYLHSVPDGACWFYRARSAP